MQTSLESILHLWGRFGKDASDIKRGRNGWFLVDLFIVNHFLFILGNIVDIERFVLRVH
jgi:hypothetical protein